MNNEPLVSQQQSPANHFLWAVRCFIDLISKDEQLTYGIGLKRLYSLSNGADTLNDDDIIAITEKSERMGLIPNNLYFFMMSSILKNCKIYGIELVKLINDRLVSIANGDLVNPEPRMKYSPAMARRYFYTPPIALIHRLQKAVISDTATSRLTSNPIVPSFNELAVDASMVLSRMQITEGHIFSDRTSWGALGAVVKELEYVLTSEATYPVEDQDFRHRSRAVLSILWVITKLLYGDLSIRPEQKDTNFPDLGMKISISDGTLASIPFPIKQTMEVFQESGTSGVSMKGRMYLSAISAAAFYRSPPNKIYQD